MGKKFFILLSIGLFLCFVYFSYLVSKESFNQFDFDLTVKIQDHISRKWDLPFSLFSLIGSAEITGLTWLVLAVFTLIKRYFLTLLSLSLFWLGLLIEVFGKVFVQHPGPPFLFYRGVLQFDFPSHFVQTDYSYPSGHLTRTAFLVTFLLVVLTLRSSVVKNLIFQLVLILLLAVMIISRIYLGEHWTTDVVGGTLLGSSLGMMAALTIPIKKALAPD